MQVVDGTAMVFASAHRALNGAPSNKKTYNTIKQSISLLEIDVELLNDPFFNLCTQQKQKAAATPRRTVADDFLYE